MSETLANLLSENRQFPPPPALAAAANVKADVYEAAKADPIGFWETQARRLTWAKEWDQALDWSNPPFAKWFVGGQLNVAYNCLDRQIEAGRGSKAAIYWVGEPGDTRCLTYADLHRMTCQAANTLTDLGVRPGDRVAIYMPMIPEAAVAMLASARIGATHSVVFGGFSVDALSGRIQDADAKVVITADGGYRRGNPGALKPIVDEAVERSPSVEKVLVVRRTGQDVAWTDGRDLWWHETVEQASPEHTAQAFDAEQPLFILYTSGGRVGHQHRTADRLQHPPADQPESAPTPVERIQGQCDRRDGEQGEAGVVDAYPPVHVAEPAERHHQDGGDQHVPHQHPQQVADVARRQWVELDAVEDGRQRDQHDRGVDRGDQHPERRVGQRDPLVSRMLNGQHAVSFRLARSSGRVVLRGRQDGLPRALRRSSAGSAAMIADRSSGDRAASSPASFSPRAARRWRSSSRPADAIATSTTRPSDGSVCRSTRCSRSRRATSWVIAGWVTPSRTARSDSRWGPHSSRVRSVDAAVRLMSCGRLSRRSTANSRSKLSTSRARSI